MTDSPSCRLRLDGRSENSYASISEDIHTGHSHKQIRVLLNKNNNNHHHHHVQRV